MKANAGGVIAPEQVVGRDTFIQTLWQRVEQQSVILTSERRIGKSSVIRKMKAQPPSHVTVILRDVEGISTIKEFVTRLVDDLSKHQDLTAKGLSLVDKFRKELSDWKIFGVTIPKQTDPNWMLLLENIINDLAELYANENKKLLMIWDEFPWMLEKIIKNEGETLAANLLDNLRLARQKHISLRMIYTGSIGLHHVLKSLKEASLANEPTNDMKVINLPPLKENGGIELTNELLKGELLEAIEDDFAEVLVKSVDCVPYYIHHVISSFMDNDIEVTTNNIETIIDMAFVDSNDPWHLRHYDTRLKEYYGEPYLIYQSILDIVAEQEDGVNYEKLNNLLQSSPTLINNNVMMEFLNEDNFLLEALRLLAADHYLVKHAKNGTYNFAFSLIKKWWSIHRK